MSIVVTCRCGSSYNLKDELAGKVVKCPKCGGHIRVPVTQGRIEQPSDPAFDRDKFLVRQKHLAISEKYYVWDEENKPILYVERPRHGLRNLFAVFAGILAGIIVWGVYLGLRSIGSSGFFQNLLDIMAGMGGIVTILVVAITLYQKRHLTFYRDDTKQERLLEILQDKKVELLNAFYTVRDASGQLLAKLRKNYLYDIFRKRWYCYAPDGSILCMAKEDSLMLSLLRRFLGNFFGLLRTNFVIVKGEEKDFVGEFNRKLTLLDRYVLDMSADSQKSIDRRIALALGVMLDTGERR